MGKNAFPEIAPETQLSLRAEISACACFLSFSWASGTELAQGLVSAKALVLVSVKVKASALLLVLASASASVSFPL